MAKDKQLTMVSDMQILAVQVGEDLNNGPHCAMPTGADFSRREHCVPAQATVSPADGPVSVQHKFSVAMRGALPFRRGVLVSLIGACSLT